MNKYRVLIVDDSPTMRRLIRTLLENDPRLEVVAEAGTASEARDAVNQHKPDVMTLDVEMPNMSGIEFLKRLMRHRPMPVVMVSTLTKKGGEIAIEALSSGAIDCIEKPKLGQKSDAFANLTDTIVMAARARIQIPTARSNKPAAVRQRDFRRICLLGGSTGAVDALEKILIRFPKECPPTLVTQHMPKAFLVNFAARLNKLVSPHVSLAEHGEELKAGHVLIAPGGDFHLNIQAKPVVRATLHAGPNVSGHRPSVDSMFKSAVDLAPNIVAGILTGMGRDGAEGMLMLKNAGALTIAQSKETCVVFGMPQVAGQLGGVEHWVDIDELGDELLRLAEVPRTEICK
ncbi:two-component system chemotaxis response regulator CheB [Pacificibacter maritimus]|uniref:Protein-glutamate methylesterase/protein-glutamine glutaminase n=1 Tax=Pacificibacter maritimus TaxID=762213 RepID=A0A3N4UNT0_9RHOB|nr:chemotaxis response regulator protein-glutamate methylesterase [Pacificibacter maritimus]RPE71678.1 two-component system chemotaxis response regulator CheB [Pacificibacter maritimus]